MPYGHNYGQIVLCSFLIVKVLCHQLQEPKVIKDVEEKSSNGGSQTEYDMQEARKMGCRVCIQKRFTKPSCARQVQEDGDIWDRCSQSLSQLEMARSRVGSV